MKQSPARISGFLWLILAAVAAAVIAPRFGAHGGPLHVDTVSGALITLVYFLHGATLPLHGLLDGARQARLHLVVQGFTFGLFPILGAIIFYGLGGYLPAGLGLGFFFLCCVSSTISSSVAMTALARGNVAAALFNATLSGVLGVVLTPLYLGFVADAHRPASSPFDAIIAVATQLLVPLVAGQCARPFIGAWLARHRRIVGAIDGGSIVLIVYGAFCDSVIGGAWNHGAFAIVCVVAVVAVTLHAAACGVAWWIARRSGLNPADRVTVIYCATQKSLANGLSIARVVLGQVATLGHVVLPLLVYHQVQLLVGSLIGRRIAAPARPT